MPLPDFISDDEMARLDAGSMPDFLSDDEMEKLSPSAPKPSLFSRVVGAGARASDYVLGGGARAIAAVERPVIRAVASARGVEDRPETKALLKTVDELEAKGHRMQSGESTYGHELAEEIPRPESGVLGHAAGGARAVTEFAGDMARDPLTYGAVGALRRFGLVGKGLTTGASAMFAIMAGKEVSPTFVEAQKAYAEDGGWTPRVTELVAKGVLLGGAAVAGGLHAVKSAGHTVAAALPDRAGAAYRADPNATPEQIAAREALDADALARENQDAGLRLDAMDSAAVRLRAEQQALPVTSPAPRTAAPMAIDAAELSPAPFPIDTRTPGAPGARIGPTMERAGSGDAAGYELLREIEEARASSSPASSATVAPGVSAPPPAALAGVPPEISRWLDRMPRSSPAEPRNPHAARAYALDGQPTAELLEMQARLSERLQRGTMTDPEARAYLQIDKALRDPGRLERQAAEAQVRAMAAVSEKARVETGTESPEDLTGTAQAPRLSVGESASLADVAARSLAPETAPRLGSAVPGVRFSPQAAETARARGAEPTPIPDARTPDGYRKLAAARGESESLWSGGPQQSRAIKARLLELWHQEREIERPGPAKREPASSLLERAGRAFVRTIEPAFEAQARMPGVGLELAGRERAYVKDWEVLKGQLDAEAIKALQSVGLDPRSPKSMASNPLSQQIYRYLDGLDPLESLPEQARPAAEALRGVQRRLAELKVERGIIKPEDVLEYHWPRKASAPESFGLKAKAEARAVERDITYDQALSELQEASSQITGTRTSRKVTSSQERATGAGALKEGEYRTDFGAYFDDLRESAREIAEHDHLGKNGQVALNLANRLEPGSLDRRFAITLLDRLRGSEQQGIGHKLSSAVRSFQSGVGLVSSPVTQLSTLGNTAAETSIPATARAVADTFLKPVAGPDGKPMSWGRPIRRMRAALNEARLDATRQGAINAGTAEGLTDYYLKTSGQAGAKSSAASNFASRLWHVRGAGWTDGLQRVIAAKTAPHIVPEAWEAAKGGNKLAQRTLDGWHVDWRKDALTPEMIDTAARRISERSQFKVGVGEIPLWASSPWGKVAFQFQSFGYAHTQFVGNALDEARRGNVKPLAKLLTVGAGMGYLTKEAKHAIFSGQAPEDPGEDDFATALARAATGKSHYATDTLKGKALGYIESLAAAGGAGILTAIPERVASRSPAKIALGATGADVDALARAAGDLGEGKVGKAAGRALEGLLPTGPLGVNPRAVAHELMSEEPIARPGYTGRLLDAAGAGPGAEARAAAGRLETASKATKAGRDELEALAPLPKEKAPIEKRAAKAEQRAARQAFVNEIARAMKRGDDAAVDEVLDRMEAAEIPLPSERYLDNLQRRVVLGLPPEDSDEGE